MPCRNFLLKLTLQALLLLFVLPSCDRQDLDISFDDYDDYRGDSFPSLSNGETFNVPLSISSSLEREFSDALSIRGDSSASDSYSMPVLAVGMPEFSGIKSETPVADIEERIYIVHEPDEALLDELGVDISYPLDSLLCIAFKPGYPGCCTVRKPQGLLCTNDCLNGLVSWVNSVEAFSESASPDNPLSYVYNVMDHTFHDGLDNEVVAHVALSKPDKMSGNVTINTRVDVTPLHGFTESYEGTGMDYYLVSSCVSIENAGMYNGNYKSRHGGVVAKLCGFYLRNYSYAIDILDEAGKAVGYFAEVPTPETAIGSSDYTTGWSFSTSGSITGGTAPAATLNAGLSSTSSTTRAMSDCDMVSKHSGSAVSYDFGINNLPHHQGVSSISSPPGISVSTANLYSQWIWAVPTKDGDTSTKYKIRFRQTKLEYGANYEYSSGADFHLRKYLLKEDEFSSNLPMPNRISTGKFCLTNSEDGTYLTNITITGGQPGKTYNDAGQYDYDKTYSLYLPIGEYELTCEIKGKDNVKRTYRYVDKINISSGIETKLSTGYNRFEITQ